MKVKKQTLRIPLRTWRIVSILQNLELFNDNMQDFLLTQINNKIDKILKSNDSAKKIVTESLELFPD